LEPQLDRSQPKADRRNRQHVGQQLKQRHFSFDFFGLTQPLFRPCTTCGFIRC